MKMSLVSPRHSGQRLKHRNKYLSLAGVALQEAVAYRYITFMNVLSNLLWVVILYYLWRTIFLERDQLEGFSWKQMQTYILLAYSLNAMIGFATANRMMTAIREGQVVIDMIRPMNFLQSHLATSVGLAVIEGVISFLLLLTLGFVFLDLSPPASALHGVVFVYSLILGFLIKFLFVFTFSLLVFWTTNQMGVNWAQTAIVNVLAGVLVPIEFLPGWLAVVAKATPFRGIVSTPISVYLGQYGWSRLLPLAALQLVWLIGLWIFAEWAWRRAFRAVEIQGG